MVAVYRTSQGKNREAAVIPLGYGCSNDMLMPELFRFQLPHQFFEIGIKGRGKLAHKKRDFYKVFLQISKRKVPSILQSLVCAEFFQKLDICSNLKLGFRPKISYQFLFSKPLFRPVRKSRPQHNILGKHNQFRDFQSTDGHATACL